MTKPVPRPEPTDDEDLAEFIEASQGDAGCGIGKFRETLDDDHRRKLDKALRDTKRVSAPGIAKIINKWPGGESISSQVVYRHRVKDCACPPRMMTPDLPT